MKQKRKAKKGVTLIEAIISVALLAILIVPLSNILLVAFQTNKDGEIKQKASFVGQKVLEEMKAYDELKLENDGDVSNDYFKLLDGDEVTEDTEDKYIMSLTRDNFRIELTVEKDDNFTYDSSSQDIDNGYDLSYKLLEKIIGVEEKNTISQGIEEKSFDSNKLTLKINDFKKANVFEKNSDVKLFLDTQLDFPLKKGISIHLDSTFSSTLNIDVDVDEDVDVDPGLDPGITRTTYVYIIKDKGSLGNVNVTSNSGNIKVNRYMNLVEEESIADLYNIDVKVYKGTDSEILFQGNAKKNIEFK